jgi:phosphofructokinase-like protein
MRVGVLTGGGDCPGTNAVIRAIARKVTARPGDSVIGFYDSWDGVMEQRTVELTTDVVRGIVSRGGTILGTRRGSPLDDPRGIDKVRQAMDVHRLDGLIVIGGNGSLTVAAILHEQMGLPVVGVPKTIDNDVVGTDATFGFQTAVQIATDAIDRLHTTAESHDRIMVVEVMGRDAGWIALHAGIAGAATAIAVPEKPFDIDELVRLVSRRHDRGRYASVVVMAEGAMPIVGTLDVPEPVRDRHGHRQYGAIAQVVAPILSERTGYDARVTQLGYVQRGGTPTSYDRVLSTRFGLAAVDAVRDGAFGQMVVLRCGQIERESLQVARGGTRRIDLDFLDDVSSSLFG